MAGDATNAALWTGADVYVAPVGTTEPTDCAAAFGAGWDAVGLLDGEEGFTEAREEESNEFYAWGGILVKRTKSKHKRTVKFVCLEDNAVVFGLVNPGSTRATVSGLTTSTVKIPEGDEFAIAFETSDGSVVKRRLVKRAEVEEVAEVKESENELTVYEVTIVIYPESDGTLYVELSEDTAAS